MQRTRRASTTGRACRQKHYVLLTKSATCYLLKELRATYEKNYVRLILKELRATLEELRATHYLRRSPAKDEPPAKQSVSLANY